MHRRILAHIATPFEPTNAYEDFGHIATHPNLEMHRRTLAHIATPLEPTNFFKRIKPLQCLLIIIPPKLIEGSHVFKSIIADLRK